MMRRLKRWFIPFVLGGALGTAGGFAAGLFVFPILFPPPAANEQPADVATQTVIGRGTFIHANPSDPIHFGEGAATIYRSADGLVTVRLESDFKVGPGPKLHVYLVDHAAVRTAADVTDSTWVDLGQLRAFEGSQNYVLPLDVNLDAFKSIVIWCKTFGVLISPARIEATNA